MKKTLLLTIMCLFGLFAELNAQCLPPQNVKVKTELNAPGYDKKYKITCTWDVVSDAEGYAIYVSTQYYPDGMHMGNVTTNEFVMGSNIEGQLYFSVRTVCDASNEIVSDRSEEVSVILSEDIQLNYDIIVTVNPENAGTVTGDGYYNVNDVVTLTASANAGYKFLNWTENGEVVSTESQYLFTFTTHRELVANFEVKEDDDNTENPEFVSKEQQKRNVLIEELTGINCQYCPDGHAIANNLIKNNPDRVWAVNVHSGGYAPTSYPNLNTTASAAICNAFTTGSFPSGIVNRSTSTAENRNYWGTYTNQQLSQNAECNIGGQIVINAESRIATATVEVYYTGNSTSENNYLTIMMLQDSILGPQSGGSTWNPSQMIGDQYVHMHILRDVITPTWGEKIAPTTAGTLIKKTYTYEIPESIGETNGVTVDLNNIHFLAFVTEKQDGTATRPILNVNQIPIVTGNEINIIASANPQDGGIVTGAGIYTENEVVTLTATTNTGYKFLNWTENGRVVSTEAKYLFIASKNRTLVANFEEITPTKYNVTATANPVNAGTISGAGTYNKNTTVTLTATPNEGYNFINWTENGNVISTNTKLTFTITSDRTLVANFEEVDEPDVTSAPLTFKYEGETVQPGTTIDIVSDINQSMEIQFDLDIINTTNADINVVAQMENLTSIGCTYLCWGTCYMPGVLEAKNVVVAGGEGTFNGHVMFVDAEWNTLPEGTEIKMVYTFFDERNPEEKYSFNVNFKYEAEETDEPDVTSAPLTFKYEGETVQPGTTIDIVSDINQSMEIQFDLDIINTTNADINVVAQKEDLTSIGCTYLCWGSCYAPGVLEAKNVVVAGGEGTFNGHVMFVDAEWNTLPEGTEIKMVYTFFDERNPEEKYSFNVNFKYDSNMDDPGDNPEEPENPGGDEPNDPENPGGDEPNDPENPGDDEETTFTITAVANPEEGGTITGAGVYEENENITLTATANELYRFVNWTEDGDVVSTNVKYSFKVTEDRELVANFELKTYDVVISVNPENAGAVTGDGTYLGNQEVTLTATPISGYRFVNWMEDGVVLSTNTEYTITVTKDRNLVANFVEIGNYLVTVAITPKNSGDVEGAGVYKENATVTLTATAKSGYKFVNWTEDDVIVTTDEEFSFEATSDRNLVANFAAIKYDVTVIIDPEEAGEVEGAGTYQKNATVTLTAKANEGYKFVSWTEDDEVVSEDAEYSFVIKRDRELIANFVSTEGVEELTTTFNIYPNPANDKLYIETEVEVEEVSIFDIYGRRQELSAVSCQPSAIDVSGLNSGVYFVKVVTNDGEVIKRFVKQ